MRWRILIAVVTAMGLGIATAAVAAPAARRAQTPALTVRPRTAVQGGRVVLYGSGFAPLARVVLLAATPGGEPVQIGRAKSNADGGFVAPVTIRRDVEPGRYVAYACRHRCRVKATAPFRVRAAG